MTTIITCPLCSWTYEVPPLQASAAIANAIGMPVDAMVSTAVYQQAGQTERELTKHLDTHQPTDWLPQLMNARTAINAVTTLVNSFTTRDDAGAVDTIKDHQYLETDFLVDLTAITDPLTTDPTVAVTAAATSAPTTEEASA